MIAVVAGTGNLPIEAIKKIKLQKKPFFVISLFPEINFLELSDASKDCAEIVSQKFYKLGSILNLLKEKSTTHILMIGKVEKNAMFKKLKFDWLSIKLIARLATKSDSEIMTTIVQFAENEGFSILRQSDILDGLIVPPGVLCGKLTDYIQENINIGLKLTQTISQADIGQTIVIKDKMVVAVEAIEGTDLCIKRAIELGKDNLIICKGAKLDQDNKFDLPTLGPKSLEQIKSGTVSAIAWQSFQTLVVDSENFVKKAEELKITLISV